MPQMAPINWSLTSLMAMFVKMNLMSLLFLHKMNLCVTRSITPPEFCFKW